MPYKNHKQYRLPGYDYSAMGDYFITVCTKDRIHHFGKIIKTNNNAFIELSAIGSFIKESILSIPDTCKNVTLGETVVMPNHIHLIITLPNIAGTGHGVGAGRSLFLPEPQQSSLQQIISPYGGLKPLTPGSVSSIINHLKGKAKKWCKANGHAGFNWQARFHDHIIRDSKAYNTISNYIANNIWNWNNDENNDDGNKFRKDIRT